MKVDIETLTLQMEPQDFVNSSETRLAVSRIITWTTEPKSSDVRKVRETFHANSTDIHIKKSVLLSFSAKSITAHSVL